jgi:hypothetical protein
MARARKEFTLKVKLEAVARYLRCPGLPERGLVCGKKFGKLSEIEFDHIAREEQSGDNSSDNCRPLCKECHALKTFGTGATSAGSDVHMAAKSKRINREGKFVVRKGGEKPEKKIGKKILSS